MINFRAKALRKRHGKPSGTRDIYTVWTEPGEIRPPRCLILCVFHSKLKDFSLAVTKLFQSSPEDLVLHDTASFLPFSSSFSPVLQHSICCFFLHCPNSHFYYHSTVIEYKQKVWPTFRPLTKEIRLCHLKWLITECVLLCATLKQIITLQ